MPSSASTANACDECEVLGDADVQARQRRDETYGERQAVQTLIDAEIAARRFRRAPDQQ